MNGDSSDKTAHGKDKYPFSLELVANIAVQILLAHKSFDKQPPLEDAVNVAVRLLQTCQTRLEEVDKSIQAKDQVVEGWEDSLRKSRHEGGGENLTVAGEQIKGEVWGCFPPRSSTFAGAAAASIFARTATPRTGIKEPSV